MSKSQMLCVDASIVVRLLLYPEDEIQSRWQDWMNDDVHLIAPTLLFYDVLNALYQYHKHDYINDDALEIAAATVLSLPIEVIGNTAIHREAITIATQLHLPATYDAHYLALASQMGVDLWTGDKRLMNAAHRNGLMWVRSLRYPGPQQRRH